MPPWTLSVRQPTALWQNGWDEGSFWRVQNDGTESVPLCVSEEISCFLRTAVGFGRGSLLHIRSGTPVVVGFKPESGFFECTR